MRFKDIDDELKEKLGKIYLDNTVSWDERMKTLCEMLGKSERTVRRWMVDLGFKRKEDIESPQYKKAKEKTFDKRRKRFIISWAQNDTPVHEQFLSNIETYAEHIKANIHIVAGRYKNPTSVFTDSEHEIWHERVIPYLDANRHNIHKYMSIMSDVKIQPTAVNPLSSMAGMSGENSCIFGSPKVQLEMIPVLEGQKPKMMLTTGACTLSNYTDSKAGKKGEFHHCLGFAIVEIKDDNVFFVRQVTALEDGSFTDLYYNVKDNKVKDINKIDGIVFGDIHVGDHDEEVMDASFKLLEKLKPKHVVLHDIFNGHSISHHDDKDPFMQYAKEIHNTNSLKREIDEMLDYLENFKKYNNVLIVRSNHDDFLDRWLKNNDWRKQHTPKNSMEYMEYSQILLEQYAENHEDVKGVIPELINKRFPKYVTLGRTDSYVVNGWELAHHGDLGSSGSRGSLQQFRKLNTKCIVGHYHKPERKDGAISVGTSTKMRVGYNKGASAWLQSHVIIHKNSKAQQIHFINGEYTTL